MEPILSRPFVIGNGIIKLAARGREPPYPNHPNKERPVHGLVVPHPVTKTVTKASVANDCCEKRDVGTGHAVYHTAADDPTG